MATRIIEYGGADRNDGLPVIPSRQFITAQTPLTATATSAQSAAFNLGTTLVCVQSDEQIYVRVGTANPTATTSNYRIAAGGEAYFSVNGGDRVALRT